MLELERETAAATTNISTQEALFLITQHAPFSRKGLGVWARLHDKPQPHFEDKSVSNPFMGKGARVTFNMSDFIFHRSPLFTTC